MTYETAVRELCLKDPLTRDPVTPEDLLEILKQDVVLAVERPGSWEGANMLQVLLCHGLLPDDC